MITTIKSTAIIVAAFSTMAVGALFTGSSAFATDHTSTTPTNPACVDGSIASNLKVEWKGDSQITVTTQSGLKLCNDVELYYSTYRMPDNYDGNGFSAANKTSYPQTVTQIYKFTLAAGTYGSGLKNVPAPDYCSNTQVDLYYGPEKTTIDQNGHGSQFIAGEIFTRDTTKCQPGMGGGTPTTPETPSVPETPATPSTPVTTPAPMVLPNTGNDASQNVLSALLSLTFGGASLMALGIRALRQ